LTGGQKGGKKGAVQGEAPGGITNEKKGPANQLMDFLGEHKTSY